MSTQDHARAERLFTGLESKEEHEAIKYRRSVTHAGETEGNPLWGLALSGGGIRSATFCLGVLQALSRAGFDSRTQAPTDASKSRWPLLARFDFLSTVSGGGYTGGFFSALFRRRGSDTRSPQDCAEEAYRALATDPPGRMGTTKATETKASDQPADRPLRWLRENGRYLAPNNTGDLFYDAAIAIRNLCAVHYVLGVTLLTTFLLMFAFRYGSLQLVATPWVNAHDIEAFFQPQFPLTAFKLWLSPWFGVLGVWVAVLVIPCGAAYWLDQDRPHQLKLDTRTWNMGIPAPFLAAIFLFAAGVVTAWLTQAKPFWISDGILFLVLGTFAAAKYWPTTLQSRMFRTRITRWLSSALTGSLIIAALALLETAGQTIYLCLASGLLSSTGALSMTAVTAAIVAVVRQFAPALAQPGKDSFLSRLPLSLILGLVGVLIGLVIAVAWYVLAATLVLGVPPNVANGGLLMDGAFSMAQMRAVPDLLATIQGIDLLWSCLSPVAPIIFWLVVVAAAGYFVGFINLSSLQTMYAARLTRAYLGASNKARFGNDRKSIDVTESDSGDDFSTADYYGLQHLGPVHLINVTINATTGSGDQLTQRDRQGIPLTVTPSGVCVDGVLMPNTASQFVVAKKVSDAVAARNPDKMPDEQQKLAAELSIGQWIGISGAAFSTGIGRGTSFGSALLFSLINIRLGWWWDSGRKGGHTPFSVWRNQIYLQRELRARFLGTDDTHWYLSDGGHYENTGVFELLRRRVAFIVCCDCGADPDYNFEDLANLMRLARIDLGAEFDCIRPGEVGLFEHRSGEVNGFFASSESELKRQAGGAGQDQKCALLYRVSYAQTPDGQPSESILLVIKPRLIDGAPLDLFEYQSKNPSFPQQTTFDQFFDEAQWESYRKLGALIGSRIFAA